MADSLVDINDRHQLYEAIWTTPVSRLCKQYGLTSYRLRKLCTQLQVPLPKQGYWARIAAGHQVSRPDLPPMINSAPGKSSASLTRRVKRALTSVVATDADASPQSTFPVLPKFPERLHPVVETLWEGLKGAFNEAISSRKRFDWEQRHPGRDYPYQRTFSLPWQAFCDRGQILAETHRKFALRVSLPSCERALKLLDVVCREAENNGYSLSMAKGCARIQLERQGANVYLRLTEKQEAGTRTEIHSWENSVSHVKTLTPTGRLTIGIEQMGWGETTISDRTEAPLEQQLDAIFKVVASRYERSLKHVAEWKQRDIDSAEAASRRAAYEQLQREAKQRAEQELARRDALIQEVGDWKRSCEIRSYLAMLDNRKDKGGAAAAGYADWRNWAASVANDLDRSKKRVALPESPPSEPQED
ncbi:hypothetical protein [Bordetella bronchiseptica]|uniref:hypothetical protein n=1 Tax=Bordetella bronchiseptica TaxID=518 RepID=UPI00128F6ACC|nr:hypothetical protein [Bordetella bronchiseptica]